MKIKFNGMMEKRSHGCNCRGKQTEYSFVLQRHFILPSGRSMTFFEGKVEEVSERDGKFLLSYSGIDVNGLRRDVFTEVKE